MSQMVRNHQVRTANPSWWSWKWQKGHASEDPLLRRSAENETFPYDPSITFLDIIHRLVSNQKPSCLYSKHNVSETGFCPRLQVKPTLLGPIDTASPYQSGFCPRLQVKPTLLDSIDRVSPYLTGFCPRLQVKPTLLDSIDRASPYLTGFCPRLQVKPTLLGPIDRASPYLRTRNVVFV
jgi:hypothetical protein